MYLKRLEMQGFKSFADKTTLEFMPGITSVTFVDGGNHEVTKIKYRVIQNTNSFFVEESYTGTGYKGGEYRILKGSATTALFTAQASKHILIKRAIAM